ncbi:MAG: hypothetical protein HON97_07160 [Polaribacter sp.]|jgi:hypothetical protein|nr:hypothetical protein [Polaribacter sp.]MBT5099874.1 hypothetical protein [Polaribacter sp.]MBT7704616.1 hypothetical protein [Polaribacter sp.]MDG1110686.1 hypothetical protein [Polaribacter sp.]
MKSITFLFLALSFVTCKSISLDTKPPFKITEASYKSWVGGQPGVHGINVYINYTSKTAIDFDSIYFRNKTVKLETKKQKERKILIGYFNTSTINSKEDLLLHKEASNSDSTKELEVPFPFILKENEAVIRYTIANVVKYYKVSNLKKEASDFYP